MNILTLFILLAALAAGLVLVWYVVSRRRHARRKAKVIASLLRKKGEAWQRLSRSAAGAP